MVVLPHDSQGLFVMGMVCALLLLAAFFGGVILLAVRSVWLKQGREVELSPELQRMVDAARNGGAQVDDRD
jgi:hypothetical protein